MKRFALFHKLLKKQKNIAWLIGLSITIALSQFVVYYLITHILGKSSLGIWSLIVAATSIGQISTFGFSSSLVRFLPELISQNQHDKVRKMIGTVNVSNFLMSLPMLVILFIPALMYGKLLLQPDQLAEFKSVLVIYMASMFLNNLFLVYSYTFDAFEKHHIRSKIQVGAWLTFLALSVLLLPAFGLKGVAIASLAQNVLQLFVALALATRIRSLRHVYPFSFDRESFRRIISFGMNSQAISVMVIFFDPLVKYFITRHTGLAGTANYELANKIVSQLRNLWVSASQVIIPKIVRHKVAGTEDYFFSKMINLNAVVSVSSGLINIFLGAIAVIIFSGHFDVFMFQIIILVNIGITVNMLTTLHYYSAIGLDKINRLVVYHMMLSAVCLVAYLLIGRGSYDGIIYFAVPPAAYLAGGIYNSFILRERVSRTYSWLKSGDFIFFIAFSLILVFLIKIIGEPVFYLIGLAALLYIYRIYLFAKSRPIQNFLGEYE